MTTERLVRHSNNLAQGQAAVKEAQRGWCIIALLYEYVFIFPRTSFAAEEEEALCIRLAVSLLKMYMHASFIQKYADR